MSSARPTQAFVLAAGFGTRMRPLSFDLPKPLMPLWNKPVLERTLLLLRRWGVRDVLINLHHQPGEILEFVRRHPVPGLRIELSFEPDILGTGGALRRAEWFIRGAPFWLINADVAAALDPAPLIRAFGRRRLAALWVHESRGPRTVEVRRGLVTDFASRRPGADGTFTFCGLHLLSPRILDWLPKEGFAGIIEAYERAMARGETIAAVCVPGSYWADIGTPRQYLEAHRERQESRRRTFAAVAPDAEVARGARIENSVVWSGARIGPRAVVRNAIVGRDVFVDGEVGYLALRADRALDDGEKSLLRRAGWDPAECAALPVGPRGSARAFTRIAAAGRSVILMSYGAEREENALYCPHAVFLRQAGLRVPAVLAHEPGNRLALLEDAGRRTLQELFPSLPPRSVTAVYRRVLDDVARLHTTVTAAARRRRIPLMPPFSAALYRWERDLFAREMLDRRLGFPQARIAAVGRELARVAGRLQRLPPVLIHRDLQSSNILLGPRGPVLIDFQGMRFGPAAYDLASLLCDPYVSLPPDRQAALLRHYELASGLAVGQEFWWAAVERLVQALGAFARLSVIPGMESFAGHIRPAGRRLLRALDAVGPLPALREAATKIAAP